MLGAALALVALGYLIIQKIVTIQI